MKMEEDKIVTVHGIKTRRRGDWCVAPLIHYVDTRWRWVLAPCSGRFTRREESSVTRLVVGYMVYFTNLEAWQRRKIYCFCQESNPMSSVL